jgi:hypothetical protein
VGAAADAVGTACEEEAVSEAPACSVDAVCEAVAAHKDCSHEVDAISQGVCQGKGVESAEEVRDADASAEAVREVHVTRKDACARTGAGVSRMRAGQNGSENLFGRSGQTRARVVQGVSGTSVANKECKSCVRSQDTMPATYQTFGFVRSRDMRASTVQAVSGTSAANKESKKLVRCDETAYQTFGFVRSGDTRARKVHFLSGTNAADNKGDDSKMRAEGNGANQDTTRSAAQVRVREESCFEPGACVSDDAKMPAVIKDAEQGAGNQVAASREQEFGTGAEKENEGGDAKVSGVLNDVDQGSGANVADTVREEVVFEQATCVSDDVKVHVVLGDAEEAAASNAVKCCEDGVKQAACLSDDVKVHDTNEGTERKVGKGREDGFEQAAYGNGAVCAAHTTTAGDTGLVRRTTKVQVHVQSNAHLTAGEDRANIQNLRAEHSVTQNEAHTHNIDVHRVHADTVVHVHKRGKHTEKSGRGVDVVWILVHVGCVLMISLSITAACMYLLLMPRQTFLTKVC